MPSESHVDIEVSLVDDGETKKVQAPPATARRGERPTLIWRPQSTDLEIQFIGFNDPVGDGQEISQPGKQTGSRNWIALDTNETAKTWQYSIFVLSNGIVYSSDPEIVNEGQGGVGEEPNGEKRPREKPRGRR